MTTLATATIATLHVFAHELTVSEEGLLCRLCSLPRSSLPGTIATATPPYDTPTQLPSIGQYSHIHQCRRSDKII